MGNAEKRLAELGITLPPVNPSQGNYVPFLKDEDLVFVSGQGPRLEGKLMYSGTVGQDVDLETAKEAARLCARNILAQLRAACDGDLDRVKQVLRIAGIVRCTADFTEQAKVIDAASELLRQALGDAGVHTRIATGTHALPSGMAVEIEAIARIA